MVISMDKQASLDVIERDRISAAIHSAEKTTSGEIFAVFTKGSDSYFIISFFMWTVFVFFCSIIVAYCLHFWRYDIPLHYFASIFLTIHLLGLFYLSIIPALRLAITPASIKNRICHEYAMRQFLAQNINRTKKRTGILLFISESEHYAEVIADTKISEKVPPETWNAIVKGMMEKARNRELTEAFVEAIKKSGEILTCYFPESSHIDNELPDHIVEL